LELLELAEKFANGLDTTIRLISKAIISCLITEYPSKTDDIICLTDGEIASLLVLLQTGSDASLCISDCTLANMLKSFMSNKTNVDRFEQQKLTSLLEQKWDTSDIDVIIVQVNNFSLDNANSVENTHIPLLDACNTGILQYYM